MVAGRLRNSFAGFIFKTKCYFRTSYAVVQAVLDVQTLIQKSLDEGCLDKHVFIGINRAFFDFFKLIEASSGLWKISIVSTRGISRVRSNTLCVNVGSALVLSMNHSCSTCFSRVCLKKSFDMNTILACLSLPLEMSGWPSGNWCIKEESPKAVKNALIRLATVHRL